jgi:hypothetical protein
MQQQIDATNNDDANGNPAGGTVQATGLQIDWQNGPLGRGDERLEPNGAFVETVIAAALQRIQYYQAGKFACEENAEAIFHLEQALGALHARTAEREARSVEGTHGL